MRRVLSLTLVLLLVGACAKTPPDTSQLSDKGRQDLQRLNIVKIVNDASTAVITANKTLKDGVPVVSDTITARVLTVNKQILDVIQANPTGYREQAIAIARNARDALPANLQALYDEYVGKILSALQAVQ